MKYKGYPAGMKKEPSYAKRKIGASSGILSLCCLPMALSELMAVLTIKLPVLSGIIVAQNNRWQKNQLENTYLRIGDCNLFNKIFILYQYLLLLLQNGDKEHRRKNITRNKNFSKRRAFLPADFSDLGSSEAVRLSLFV